MKKYTINGKYVTFKPHVFEGTQSLEFYENQIYNALSKIGVSKDYIEVNFQDLNGISFAQVKWFINGRNFVFRCDSQENAVRNLGAIAQAISEDVRQITRGIKDLFLIMTQYESKEIVKTKKRNLLAFGGDNDVHVDDIFKPHENKIDNRVNDELNEDFKYLLKYSIKELDEMYFRVKEQCSLHNVPNNKLFIALKIVRQKRGLDL